MASYSPKEVSKFIQKVSHYAKHAKLYSYIATVDYCIHAKKIFDFHKKKMYKKKIKICYQNPFGK